jgi:hypothetical protein
MEAVEKWARDSQIQIPWEPIEGERERERERLGSKANDADAGAGVVCRGGVWGGEGGEEGTER